MGAGALHFSRLVNEIQAEELFAEITLIKRITEDCLIGGLQFR
jgi:hypothetical protein